MKNTSKYENSKSTNNIAVSMDKKPEDTTGNACFTITPMEKQDKITIEYAASYLFSGIEVADKPTGKQILKLNLRLFGIIVLCPFYLLYALVIAEDRIDDRLWWVLVIPMISFWLYKCIFLILSILF